MVEKGKMVKISYEGYVDGKLFDTTNEELAKKEGIYSPNMVYGPATIFVGEGQVLPGLDELLLEMDVGEEREVVLPPEKAFGKRDPSKIKLIPMSEFKKRGIKPFKGMVITIDGVPGKVVSINSGRVLVDFNHELAGREVKYKIKIEEVIDDKKDIVKEIIKMYVPRLDNVKVSIRNGTVKIELPEFAPFIPNIQTAKMAIANEILKRLQDVEKVSFVETFERKKTEE
ncbi:peptidylprolyl isomerase FKBP-type [Methanocaldococcus vulcanius M7]|uniref:Peptidyl-prolyl cis-trans isomerase n=1 Tax=Methanocaldococcus vulcanius (strain ATCC 700851 / DSM 12094 / M7) TaxID=579137 RepID=C9REJ0_METVM|nr:peptidylprolyl isomerase [Methanocaldococcus vulcanius]ACX71992.1 peptidylprolyl isomerase FKBP-type [Methanocaldococcus vulcanius M7]